MWERTFVGEEEVIKMNAELAVRRDFTVEDIEHLPDGVRAELIDGQIFYFAAPRTVHQKLQAELFYALLHQVKTNEGTCSVFAAPLSVKLVNDGKNYLEPDIVVICDSNHIQEDGCYGAPDLIIEIVSKSTSKRDYGIKM